MEPQTIVYQARLNVCRACIIRYINIELNINKYYSESISMRPQGIFINTYYQEYGEEPQEFKVVDKIMHFDSNKRNHTDPSTFIHIFWNDDNLISLGWSWTFGLRQFSVGQIKITNKIKAQDAVDILIICDWISLLPYWEWIKQKLQANFHERRKGGPVGISLNKKIGYVKDWHKVRGRQNKESFCRSKYFSASSLTKWERELKDLGLKELGLLPDS